MYGRIHSYYSEIKKRQLGLSAWKYFFRWNSSMRRGRESMEDRQPWMPFPIIDFLNKEIGADSKIFEFGGGGSTLFFLDRTKEVITVEHNPDWFHDLNLAIDLSAKSKWTGLLIEPEKIVPTGNEDPSDPADYCVNDKMYSGLYFKNYAISIERYPDNTFDLVVVDGRARPSCIKHAIHKIKKNGYLLVDNSDREYYFFRTGAMLNESFRLLMNDFAPCPYLMNFTKAALWQKK